MNKVHLVLDAGNSSLKAGVFLDRVLREKCVLPFNKHMSLTEMIEKWQPEVSLLIASSDQTGPLEMLLSDFPTLKFRYRLSDCPKPFPTKYLTPETLGEDRIAGLAGAMSVFPGQDILLVQMGTCITYDLMIDGVHAGGAITPGLNMRFKSLNAFTAKLPMISLGAEDVHFPGLSTQESMAVGVTGGIAAEIDSFVSDSRKFSKKINVILTGGDAERFAPRLKSPIFATPNLTLIGLNEILHLRK